MADIDPNVLADILGSNSQQLAEELRFGNAVDRARSAESLANQAQGSPQAITAGRFAAETAAEVEAINTASANAFSSSTQMLERIDTLLDAPFDLFNLGNKTVAGTVAGKDQGLFTTDENGKANFAIRALSPTRQRAVSALNFLKANAFLQQVPQMQGLGHLSNAEGERLADSYNEATGQNPPDDERMVELLKIMQEELNIVKRRNDPNNPMRVINKGVLLNDGTVAQEEREVTLTEFLATVANSKASGVPPQQVAEGTNAQERNPESEDLSGLDQNGFNQKVNALPVGGTFIFEGQVYEKSSNGGFVRK